MTSRIFPGPWSTSQFSFRMPLAANGQSASLTLLGLELASIRVWNPLAEDIRLKGLDQRNPCPSPQQDHRLPLQRRLVGLPRAGRVVFQTSICTPSLLV